ncbi:hypothetical protein NESM_000352500 [Novymonas esmeraldas]|uniref:HEAT repeat-containing protein 1 n=1 Tax=Novymonas esmeraldas TaxID=1808958 RepID=A0AAW0EMH6_9TRYP
MPSQLASQLQRLQQRPDESQHRLAKSFLFDTQDAQSFSREQIHQLAMNGLQTLTAMDNRLHSFLHDVLDVKRVRQERSMLSTADDAALRHRLEHLLTLLSPHLFLTAAQQVFECLVRVHEVHLYDVAAVLRAFLPYHDHNIFARALLLLDLRDTGFDFLATNQLRGAPLLREHLVLACAESRKAARLVCLTVAMPFRHAIRHHAANALFAGVVTRLAAHTDAEALWRTFLPVVLELLSGTVTGAEAGTEESKRARQADDLRGAGSRVSAESVATALVVLAAWSSQVRFSSATLSAVLKPLLHYTAAAAFAGAGEDRHGAGVSFLPVRDLLALLEVVFATQHRALTDVAVAPLLQTLWALPWRTLAPQLPFAAATEVVAGPGGVPTTSPRHSVLLATLLQMALERLSSVSETRLLPADVVEFLTCAAEDLPLSNTMAARYLRTLMTAEAGAADDDAAEAASLYHRVVAALERRYAVVLDGVLSEVLLHAGTATAANAFLARHFSGTRYGMVEVGSALAGVTESLPLFACLLHPVPEVRAVAAQTLQRMPVSQLIDGAGGQSLVDLLVHVVAYEHHSTAAAAFVVAAAAVMERLVAPESGEAAGRAACQLVRALYSMALTWSPAATAVAAARAPADASAHALAQQHVVLPLVTTVLRPTLRTCARDSAAELAAVRASALYHTALLYTQWSAAAAAAAETVVRELVAALEDGCGGSGGLAPLLCSSGTSASAAGRRQTAVSRDSRGTAQRQRGGRRGAATAESNSDDSDDGDSAPSGSHDRSGAAATADESAVPLANLLRCGALLAGVQAEARRRLPDAFAAARTAVREAATAAGPAGAASSAAEIVVALAAALLPAIDAGDSSDALDVVSSTTAFLHGSDAVSPRATTSAPQAGYLDIVYAALLDGDGGKRAAATVGRGAVDAAAAAHAELYKSPLLVRIGQVLRVALSRTLAAATAAPLVLQLCRCLGVVGAPLPCIVEQPDVLAPVYLELVDSMPAAAAAVAATETQSGGAAALRQTDWLARVEEALFGVVGETDCAGATHPAPATLAALAVALFLPLRAATAQQRLAQLRALQDAVVTAGARRTGARGGAGRTTGVQVVVAAALQPGAAASSPACSVTALSCLIECMAEEECHAPLTAGAAALLCSLLALHGGADTHVVPAGLAFRAVRHFFRVESGARPRAGAAAAAATASQVCLIEAMLPRVEAVLTHAGGADAAARAVSTDAADLVDAVCSRLHLWGAAQDKDVARNASVRMVELLLRHPYVHVQHGGGARPVYRHALTALVVGLSSGLEGRQTTHSTIFTQAKKSAASATGGGADAMTADYQRLVAAYLRPFVLRSMDVIGADVALACMGTVGGYEYIFLPLVASLESTAAASTATPRATSGRGGKRQAAAPTEAPAPLLQRVWEMLEVLAPSAETVTQEEGQDSSATAPGTRWRPPTSTAVAHPLTVEAARRVLRLPSVCAAAATAGGGPRWALDAVSRESLRLLQTLLRVLPTIVVDDEEDGDGVYALVLECMELYPLQEMEALLRQAAASAAAEDVAMLPRIQQMRLGARGSLQVEGVLQLVSALVRVCTEQTRLLSEKVADGAYQVKSRLLREIMVLMARVLVDDDADAAEEEQEEERRRASAAPLARGADAADAAGRRESELHFNVDTIASLLRATAPLLKVPTGAAAATRGARAKEAAGGVSYLHVPLVSLLIKLEAVDGTEALGFRSAREVCQEILTSFDVRTQVQCLAQLLRLVADPTTQLSSTADAAAVAEDGEGGARQSVQRLFRRMVKPNQVINRQEAIMHLINMTVKSDLFLEPFLALQRRARSSQPGRAALKRHEQQRRRGNGKAAAGKESDGDDEDEDADESADGAVQREDGGCMELLVSALELFARYHDLHQTTRSSAESDAEAEAYTSLLELLAGNTLACVLAGINEPTFVVCQQRLLEDKRAALRKIGLEVLLDRLHHSLPTLENVVSDEEMEAHRRRLRDPRQRLSLIDLVRTKARPLTTKRSVQLFPILVGEVKSSLAQLHVSLQSADAAVAATAAGELLGVAQLGIAAVEELVRIVGSGGSLQSEKTLLNAHRSKRVTEAALVKLFGNRGRVADVHGLVDLICDHWMPLLSRCETRLRSAGAAVAAQPKSQRDGDLAAAGGHARVEEGVLGCMTCLVTALATITQVMGTGFASTHCLSLLHTLASAGVYQVMEMSTVVSRSEAGALLRHSTLSSLIRCLPACWQMMQPYLSSMLFLATHLTNVLDAESHYLCAELLAVLEAVLEPQLLLDAGTACLQGIPYLNGAVVPASEQHQLAALTAAAAASASRSAPAAAEAAATGKRGRQAAVRTRQIRVQVHTHSFALLFTCIERRLESMSKEELTHMPTLTDGTTPQQNFWLAAFQALASAPSVPSSEAVMPVLQAFTVFLLKFKAKHGARLLRIVADWAFAESSGGVAGASRKRAGESRGDDRDDAAAAAAAAAEEEELSGRGHDGVAQSASRLTLQSWVIFFALANHLLRKLGSILDFAYPVVVPHAVTTLRTYCATTATATKATDSLVALALEGALECVRNMALAQTPGADHDYSVPVDVFFAHPDVFPSVMPALAHQLHNMHYLEDGQHDYRFRVEHSVIPALRSFMACLGSSKLQSRTQAEVVRALRHPSRHVRREALVCLDGIYADGGDELASRLMAEMLPTVVELTEDRDDAVVEAARKLCNNLSHMTGQDVLYAMS